MVNIYNSPERCAGFAQTELKTALDGDGSCVVSNIGKVAAVGVMLDLGKDEDKAVVEDNFFFLPAGESRSIAVSPSGVVKGVSALNSRGVLTCRTIENENN